jgi:L-threonylcarbamoyladenylate synthase
MPYFTDRFDEKVIELLQAGGVGLVPTDTVYGLSALALSQQSVEKIFNLKERDDGKPCIILIGNINQAGEIGIDPAKLEPVKDYWPAALTFIAPAPNAPEYLHRGMQSLGVRIPKDDSLRELLSKLGPLVSTSANLQNEPVAHNTEFARKYFGEKLDFYVDGGELNGDPSTIAKITDGKLEILRQGAWQMPS